ncbi:unnamed protein product [Urochloa humidicola]
MSSSSPVIMNPLVGHPVAEKLSKAKYAPWKAQVRAAVRGARLEGHLTGTDVAPDAEIIVKVADKEEKKPNPAYEHWEAQDQQVLSYLLSSLSTNVLTQVSACETAAEAWKTIEATFASQSRAKAVNVRLALSTTKKGNMSIVEYFTKMKGFGDEMAAAGRPLQDEDLIEYILTGLDEDFTPLVSALVARVEPVSVDELYSQLLSFETRLELIYGPKQQGGSANYSNRGGRGNRGGRAPGRGRGRGPGRGDGGSNPRQGSGSGGYNNYGSNNNYSNQRSSNNYGNDSKPLCQVCFKKNHTAAECWHRFDEDYVPDKRLVAAASRSYSSDPSWYADTGASDHVASNLEKLQVRDKYNGTDQIHTASGTGSGHEEYHP